MTLHHEDDWLTVYAGDARAVLAELEAESVQAVVTSPPYWGLRDYGTAGQLGTEPTPDAYVAALVEVFRQVRRVLRADGTVWLNLGDTYASSGGHNRNGDGSARLGRANLDAQNRGSYSTVAGGLKPKDLVGIPWRVALALQADGWWLRSDIVWHKPNATPESVEDRPTRAHEYLFLLTKAERYYFDQDAVREPHGFNRWGGRIMTQPDQTKYEVADDSTVAAAAIRRPGRVLDVFPEGGRNIRTVWSIPTVGFDGAHFATFPPDLVKPCILAGTPERGVCATCGAPWRRVVELGEVVSSGPNKLAVKPYSGPGADRYARKPGTHADWGDLGARQRRTTGWEPSCEHDTDPVPATVLDPFAGSGTTGQIAQALSRRAVLIELNPEYLELALDRAGAVPLGL